MKWQVFPGRCLEALAAFGPLATAGMAQAVGPVGATDSAPELSAPAVARPGGYPGAAVLLDPSACPASMPAGMRASGDPASPPPAERSGDPSAKRSGDPPARRKARVVAARKALLELDRRLTIDRLPQAPRPSAAAAASPGRPSGHLVSCSSAMSARPGRYPNVSAPRGATTAAAPVPLRETGVVQTGGTTTRPSPSIPRSQPSRSQAGPSAAVARAYIPAPAPRASSGGYPTSTATTSTLRTATAGDPAPRP